MSTKKIGDVYFTSPQIPEIDINKIAKFVPASDIATGTGTPVDITSKHYSSYPALISGMDNDTYARIAPDPNLLSYLAQALQVSVEDIKAVWITGYYVRTSSSVDTIACLVEHTIEYGGEYINILEYLEV